MHQTTISHLKVHLSAALKRVKQGHTLLITERNVPIAKVVPLSNAERSTYDDNHIAKLIRDGIVEQATCKKLSPKELQKRRIKINIDVVKVLLDEREQSPW